MSQRLLCARGRFAAELHAVALAASLLSAACSPVVAGVDPPSGPPAASAASLAGAPTAPPAREAPAPRIVVDHEGAALLRAAQVDGAFVLLDPKQNVIHVVNPERAATQYTPASTFKIPNTLIGLETGVIPDERFSLRWDGVERRVNDWNRDHDLASAMKHSVVWFYQEVARRIGPTRMKQHIDAIGYGNRDISGGIDQFWLHGGLRISPHEQVEFLRALLAGELPFSRRSVDILKGIIVLERTPDYVLSGKTGLAVPDEGPAIGWLVGYIERGADVSIYATVLLDQSRDPDRLMPLRHQLARAYLRRYGLLPG